MKEFFKQYFDMGSVPDNPDSFKSKLTSESLLNEFEELIDKLYEDEGSQHDLETRLQGLRWGLVEEKIKNKAENEMDEMFLNKLRDYESRIYGKNSPKVRFAIDTPEEIEPQSTFRSSI
jgi:hypothetical protein